MLLFLTWHIWTKTQSCIRMNVFDWARIVFDSKSEVSKPSSQYATVAEKWERSHSPRSHMANRRKVNWNLLFEYFRTVLPLVSVIFMSTFTGSRSILMHNSCSSKYLVFFSLQLIYRQTLEFRVDFFLTSQKKVNIYSKNKKFSADQPILFWHVPGNKGILVTKAFTFACSKSKIL